MIKITENQIKLFAIELLESLGFEYIYTSNVAPKKENING